MTDLRSSRSDPRQAGFTLLEVLTSLAIVSLLTFALLEGVGSLRRTWDLTRARQAVGDDEAAVAIVSDWLAAAVAVSRLDERGLLHVVFVGAGDELTFVSLGEGRGGPAGLVLTHIGIEAPPGDKGRQGQAVRLTTASYRGATPLAESLAAGRSATLMDDVLSIRFAYFGADYPGRAPEWHDAWSDRNSLPLLVSIDVVRRPPRGKLSATTALRLAF